MISFKSIGMFFILMLFLVTAGCTDLERRGYSPIPQNSPASWQMNPYGSMRN